MTNTYDLKGLETITVEPTGQETLTFKGSLMIECYQPCTLVLYASLGVNMGLTIPVKDITEPVYIDLDRFNYTLPLGITAVDSAIKINFMAYGSDTLSSKDFTVAVSSGETKKAKPFAKDFAIEIIQNPVTPAKQAADSMRKLFHQIIDAGMIPHNNNNLATIKTKQYNGWEPSIDELSWNRFITTQADDFCNLFEKTLEKDRSVNNAADMALMLDRLLHNFRLPRKAIKVADLGFSTSTEQAIVGEAQQEVTLHLNVNAADAIKRMNDYKTVIQGTTKAINEFNKAQAKVKT